MKRIISILLTIAVVMNIMPVMALDLSADTDYITEENVICNMMQSNAGTFSLSAVDEVDSGFDIVLGIDMSIDMLNFDYNYDKEWINTFLAIQEQAPEDTVFSTVISNTDSVASGLEEIESSLEAARYSGESDIISLLDKCVEAFDSTSDATKIIVASAATTGDASALQSKVEEVMESGMIPFVFILEEEPEDTVEMDAVYYCPDNLSLRLAMSELYLSFGELNQAATANTYSLQSTTTTTETTDTDIFNSDFRKRHLFKYNDIITKGSALVSVLNAYSLLPVRGTDGNKSYDLAYVEFASGSEIEYITNEQLISFFKGNSSVLNGATNISYFQELWTSIYEKRENTNNIENIIYSNLKKRFPVAATYKESNKNSIPCVISTWNSGTQKVGVYTADSENITEIEISKVDSVFDTYRYLSEMAVSSKRIKSATVQVGASINLLKVYPLNYSANDVEIADDLGILQNDEICTRVNNANLLDLTVDLAQINWSGGEVPRLVYRANVGFNENGVLDFYDPAPFYTLRLYNDVMSSKEWYYPYLMEATNLGVVNGDTEHNFKPIEPVKRCEFIKMLLEAAQIPTEEPAADEITEGWSDDWAYPYMKKASELGIFYLTGVDNIEVSLKSQTFYEEQISRAEVAYTIKTLLIDKRNEVQVPTLMYEYSTEIKSQRTADWEDRLNKLSEEPSYVAPEKVEESVYQLFMNDIMVGDQGGYMHLDEKITRAEVMKMVIKPLFEFNEDVPQIVVNNVSGSEVDGITNYYINKDGLDIQDVIFDSNKEKHYTLTINESDSTRYYVGTYGGLLEGERVNLTLTKSQDTQKVEVHTGGVDGHPAYSIEGAGVFNITVSYEGDANVGLRVNQIGGALPIEFSSKRDDGHYIYDDHPEYIRKCDILDEDGYDPSALLHTYELQPGVYNVFAYHHVSLESVDDKYSTNVMFSNGTELYFDAIFSNHEGSAGNVRINKLGCYTHAEKGWQCNPDALNDYLNGVVDNSVRYINSSPLWLSDIMGQKKINDKDDKLEDDTTKPHYGIVHLLMEFEVLDGTVDFTTVAYKNKTNAQNIYGNGYTPTNIKSKYQYSETLKGIASEDQTLVANEITYAIDNELSDGIMNVEAQNQFYEEIETNRFLTNCNPWAYPQNFVGSSQVDLSLKAEGFIETKETDVDGNEEIIRTSVGERTWYFDSFHTRYLEEYIVPDSVKNLDGYNYKDKFAANERFDDNWLKALGLRNNEAIFDAFDGNDTELTATGGGISMNFVGFGITHEIPLRIINCRSERTITYIVEGHEYEAECITDAEVEISTETRKTDSATVTKKTFVITIPANKTTEITIRTRLLTGSVSGLFHSFSISKEKALQSDET